jgi:hypothetical protein
MIRDHEDDAPLDATLRLQLRGLRRDIAPEADLWPGIAARIAEPRRQVRPRSGAQRYAPWALAASLVLAVGVAWKMQPPPAATDLAPSVEARLLAGEADAMTREYRAALQEVQASKAAAPPPQALPALDELDRSALQIRNALDEAPGARYLLERLRHTYTLRLELTRRLPIG